MKRFFDKSDRLLFGKYSDWVSGLVYLVLPVLLTWLGKLVSGNVWVGLVIGLSAIILVLFVVMIRQRSRLGDLMALKAGLGLRVVPIHTLKSHLDSVVQPELPKGLIWLRWAKFRIEPRQDQDRSAVVVVSVRPTSANEADLVDIPVGFDRVTEMYLLITTGYGVKSFQGAQPGEGWDEKAAGHLELVFSDGTKQEFPLRLGYDIREFTFGNQPWAIDALRKEGETSFQVWHSSHQECTLDMLAIQIEGQPRRLDKIRIVAQMEKGAKPIALQEGGRLLHDVAYPAIQVFAVTCRIAE